MRILLIHPPCGPRTMGVRHIARLEPLGLELIGAAVSGEHDVRLVDILGKDSAPGRAWPLSSRPPVMRAMSGGGK